MMAKHTRFLAWHLALGFAIVLASGCDSRLLVGNNPDAGNAGASGTMGSSRGGNAGSMASAGTMGTPPSSGLAGSGAPLPPPTDASPLPPVTDAGIPLDVWIAFDSDGAASNRDIYVIRADGTGRRRLTTVASMDVQPSFSRDGTKLAFASDRGGAMQVYVMDLATGAATRVTQRAEGAHDPAFMIDGTRVGYRSGISVFTAKLDGTDERQATDGQTCCMGGPFGGPVYPSDGQTTIYDDYNAIYSTTSGSIRRAIVPPTTGEQSHPSLSPDGSAIVLQVTCGDDNAARSIWAVPATGITGFTCYSISGSRLSPHMTDATHASWGPNNMIVWGSVAGGNNSQSPVPSALVAWQDGTLTMLTDGSADDRNPSWSPAGTVIGTW